MTMTFRTARRSEAKPLIGLYSESGNGKTLSALYLARGFVGPTGKIGMIETESGRGEVYADTLPGGYMVLPMREVVVHDGGTDAREDFAPRTMGEAIDAAEAAGLDALIIDSASHEWEGIGGVLYMAAANMDAGKKGVQAWQKPKIDHQRHFIGRLLRTPIKLVILCMRAKYPMEEVTKNGKKEWQRSERLEPKQSEDILFEMFVHGWIDKDHNFQATKYTRPDMAQILPTGQPISIATGEALAKWAAGGATTKPQATQPQTGALADVLAGYTMAQTDAEIMVLVERCKRLAGADKDAARAAHKRAVARIKADASAPPPADEPPPYDGPGADMPPFDQAEPGSAD